MWCKQCKAERPPEKFYPVARGWKVEKCDDCARANMNRWARRVETDPEKVRRQARDE